MLHFDLPSQVKRDSSSILQATDIPTKVVFQWLMKVAMSA